MPTFACISFASSVVKRRGQLHLLDLPPVLHDSIDRMVIRSNQQMSDFMGNKIAEDHRKVRFRVSGNLGKAQDRLIVHIRQDRMDSESKHAVRKVISQRSIRNPYK